MTSTWKEQVAWLVHENKVSPPVISITRGVLERLPQRVVDKCVLSTTDDYGVTICWDNYCLEIRQASAPTIFVWLTFDRIKTDKITTGEERVFTSEDMLYGWISRHQDEL